MIETIKVMCQRVWKDIKNFRVDFDRVSMCRLWSDTRSALYFERAVYKGTATESCCAAVDLFSVLVFYQQICARCI